MIPNHPDKQLELIDVQLTSVLAHRSQRTLWEKFMHRLKREFLGGDLKDKVRFFKNSLRWARRRVRERTERGKEVHIAAAVRRQASGSTGLS